jgi:chromosome segregation ATPase
LIKQGYSQAAQAFLLESKLDYDGYIKGSSTPASLLKDVLERKWTSIARLKKQVMDLEKQCKQLKETNDQYQIDITNYEKQINGMTGGTMIAKKNNNNKADEDDKTGDAIPREPERTKLKGHRAKITKIAFHPIYT